MKIAQVVAATGVGGNPRDIERSAGYLSAQLVAEGHDVTLLTCVVPTSPVRSSNRARTRLPPMASSLDRLIAEHSKFDIIHLHGDIRLLSALHASATPIVATLYSHPNASTLAARATLPDVALVALTGYQRALFNGLHWHATVSPGLPEHLHTFRIDSEGYLAYAGSVQSTTALQRAVEVALISGLPLRVPDRILGRELRQIEELLAPFIERGASVEFVGELEPKLLGDFLGRARALLFMDDWPDPLPLSMLDALCSGTPIVAWRSGTSNSVVRDGETGFLVSSVDDAARAIARLHEISRLSCRRTFDERFGIKRVAQQYLCLYEEVRQSARQIIVRERGSLPRYARAGKDGAT